MRLAALAAALAVVVSPDLGASTYGFLTELPVRTNGRTNPASMHAASNRGTTVSNWSTLAGRMPAPKLRPFAQTSTRFTAVQRAAERAAEHLPAETPSAISPTSKEPLATEHADELHHAIASDDDITACHNLAMTCEPRICRPS